MFIQNVCRTKDIFCNVTYKVHRDLNNKINSSPILECPSSAFMHAFNCWVSFTYKSCDRSLWLVIPDHLQCWLDHGGSVNNKCFTKSNKKLSKNISDETYCLRSLLHFGVISSTIFLIHLFQCSLFRTEIFECAKITRWSHKKFCNFAVIESNQIPLGIFMCIWTSNKRVKFHVKIPSCCLENGKQL